MNSIGFCKVPLDSIGFYNIMYESIVFHDIQLDCVGCCRTPLDSTRFCWLLSAGCCWLLAGWLLTAGCCWLLIKFHWPMHILNPHRAPTKPYEISGYSTPVGSGLFNIPFSLLAHSLFQQPWLQNTIFPSRSNIHGSNTLLFHKDPATMVPKPYFFICIQQRRLQNRIFHTHPATMVQKPHVFISIKQQWLESLILS